MKLRLLFASDLPCKLIDYEFTGLDRSTKELLEKCPLKDKLIKSKGKYSDYFGRRELDAIVVLKDKKDSFKAIFRILHKDYKRSFEPILGLQMPEHPEMVLVNENAMIYAFGPTFKHDLPTTVSKEVLEANLVTDKLANDYIHVHSWVNPLSSEEGSGSKLKLNDYLTDEELEEVTNLLSRIDKTYKSLKLDIFQGHGMKRVSAAVIGCNDYEIDDSYLSKSGDPVSIEKFPDLHNHLLPGVDDGSNSEMSTLELSEDLKKLGVTKIVLTPHNNEDFHNLTLYKERFDELMKQEDLPEMYLSAENKITEDFLRYLVNENSYLFHPNGFLLIEFSKDQEREYIIDAVGKLSVFFSRCLLAHPCRYKNLTVQDIEDIASMGILTQCNLKSLDEDQDRDVINKLQSMIDKGLVDVISTDTHYEDHIEQSQGKLESFKENLIFNNAII